MSGCVSLYKIKYDKVSPYGRSASKAKGEAWAWSAISRGLVDKDGRAVNRSETGIFRSYLEALVRAATLAQHLDMCDSVSGNACARGDDPSEVCLPSVGQTELSESLSTKANSSYNTVKRIGG